MTMKLNKSKGKVHPSPSSSSSSSSPSSSFSLSSTSSSTSSDPVSALNLLLPAAILTLISVLSLQDREVLAYMITRSLKSALTLDDNTNTNRKRKPKKSAPPHKSPSFDCGCFECYTSYWFRWDSSPHRELIHQAIEAFEEHLASTEQTKKAGKGRRREKDKSASVATQVAAAPEVKAVEPEPVVVAEPAESPEIEIVPVENGESCVAGEETTVREERENDEEMSGARRRQQQEQQHKGLARKVLPDVIGLLNSRLWNLWGPNV